MAYLFDQIRQQKRPGSTDWKRYAGAPVVGGNSGGGGGSNSFLGTFLKLARKQIPRTTDELLERYDARKAIDAKYKGAAGGASQAAGAASPEIRPFTPEWYDYMAGRREQALAPYKRDGGTFNDGSSLTMPAETAAPALGEQIRGAKPKPPGLIGHDVAAAASGVGLKPFDDSSSWGGMSPSSGGLSASDEAFEPAAGTGFTFDPVTGEMIPIAQKKKPPAEDEDEEV